MVDQLLYVNQDTCWSCKHSFLNEDLIRCSKKELKLVTFMDSQSCPEREKMSFEDYQRRMGR